MARQTKPRRYSGTPDFYKKKLEKNLSELGLKKDHWILKYDPWEGARLDFTTPKGFRKTLQRMIDNQTIHYGSDCIAQIALAMERFAWLKREGIFDLDTLVAGLPELMAPVPEYFRELGFDRVPDSIAEVDSKYKELLKVVHPDVGGSAERFKKVHQAYGDAKRDLEVR
jgi:hypothetical protein